MAGQTDEILRQMDEAEERTAAQSQQVDQKLQHELMILTTWENKGLAAEAGQAREREAKHQKEELDLALTGELRRLRQAGQEALKADKQAIRAAVFEARLKQGPQGAEAWAEASSRAQFVREDLQGLQPAQIVEQFELARTAGDTVGAWLIARYARQILEAGIAERASAQLPAVDWHMALDQIDKATDAELGAEEMKRLRELSRLESELSRTRTKTEEREIARRFGIRQYD